MTEPSGPDAADAHVPHGVQALARVWHQLESALAMVAFGCVALLLMFDVLGREIVAPLLRSIGVSVGATTVPGGPKIAVFAMIVGAFCGVGIATATSSHLVPRIGFGWVPARWSGVVARMGDLFTAVFLSVVAGYALEFVLATKGLGTRAAVLNWEVWPFQLAIPAGFASAALRYALFAAYPGLKPSPPEAME